MIDTIEISNEIVILYLDTITLQVEKLSEIEDCRAQKLIGRPWHFGCQTSVGRGRRRESDVKEKTEQRNIGAVYGRIQMTERSILINQNSNIIDPIKKRDKGGRDDFVVNE